MRSDALVLFFAVALFSLSQGAQARGPEFLENYKNGLAAVESEDWNRAERLMRSAIEGRNQEAKRLPRFLYVKPYLPHFYLGLALFEQDNCSAAFDVWAVSERQGVIQKRPQFDQIRLAQELCRERAQVSEEPAVPSTASPPRPSEMRSASPPSPRATPWEQRPAVPPATAQPAPRPVRSVDHHPSPALRFTEPEAQHRVAASGPPSELLRSAATSFLDGSYADVIDQLSTDMPSDDFAKAQSHLLMAASELALFLAGGERDTERLERSRQHVLGVRAALPDFEPPETYFSPRFLDFFYGQRPEEER